MANRYTTTERVGVNAVEAVFLNEFKWIFREQPIVDMGIDTHVEVVDEQGPTGKLLGVQIKTGASHFHETLNAFTYYLDETHYRYWMNHSLPVFLIGHLPERNLSIWQYIDKQCVVQTKKGWKVILPKNNSLADTQARYRIEEIVVAKTPNGKLTKFLLDRELMRFLQEGNKINIRTQEWHNKSLVRGPFKVLLIKDGDEDVVREWSSYYTYSLEELIARTFPWADAENDPEFYAENFDDSVFEVYSQGWLDSHQLYPYEVYSGEVGAYCINLTLNKTGRAFLDLTDYFDS
ncbi:MAG: DUF4365 domain-containing protein [Hymenobacter sp.]|nr:MAG: DUF4365 domain-containing protein [Hymenobacter sp.]